MDVFTELKETKSLLDASLEKLEDDDNKEAKDLVANADRKITELSKAILFFFRLNNIKNSTKVSFLLK